MKENISGIMKMAEQSLISLRKRIHKSLENRLILKTETIMRDQAKESGN